MQNIVDEIKSAWRSAWNPVDRRPIYERLAGKIKLPSCYGFPGDFSIDKSPFLRKPLEKLGDDTTKRIFVYAPVRTGKTLMLDLFAADRVLNEPGDMMFNLDVDENAEDHWKTRLKRLFSENPILAEKLPTRKNEIRKSLILFPGMALRMQGHRTLSNLQRIGLPYVLNDECWLAPNGHLSESERRTDDFRHRKKFVCVGQGGTAGDEFDLLWREGTQEIWSFACPVCGEMQPWTFGDTREDGSRYGLVWEKSERTKPDGKWHFDLVKKSVVYECKNLHCKKQWKDTPTNRRAMNARCEYVAKNTLAASDSFSCRYDAVCVDWMPWGELAIEWLKAMTLYDSGDETGVRIFKQKRRAEPFEEIQMIRAETNPSGDYELDDEWDDEVTRYMTIDKQAGKAGNSYLVGVVRAFAADGRSRLVWASNEIQDEEEARFWQLEFGVTDRRVHEDLSFEPDEVAGYCARYGWTALAGSENDFFYHSPAKAGGMQIQKLYSKPSRYIANMGKKNQGAFSCVKISWSKPQVFSQLHRLKSGTGIYWGLPRNVSEVYLAQLNSMQKKEVMNARTGEIKIQWRARGTAGDHFFDCECMQLVAWNLERDISLSKNRPVGS